MGIKDIGTYTKQNTNAYFILPYNILSGEHVVYDGNEMIYRYVSVIFSKVKFEQLRLEIQELDDWMLIDWLLGEYWDDILALMMSSMKRFPDDTYITFIMDGIDNTGLISKRDALGGMFSTSIKKEEGTLLFTNYESSSDNDTQVLDLSYEKIEPVYVDSGNIIPTIDTENMKTPTWERREKIANKTSSEIRLNNTKNLSGLFRMTNLAKLLIHELISNMPNKQIDVIYAGGEADFLIALYCNEMKAFACITRDGDQLAYGSDLHIIKHDTQGLHVRYIPYILRDLCINKEQLRQWCILLGCDYNTRIKGMGPANALKVVKGIIKEGDKGMPSKMDLDIIANFEECWNIFSSASGYEYVDCEFGYTAKSDRVMSKIINTPTY